MFSNTKYTKWYYEIIKKYSVFDENIFTEKHHIIPKSLGGQDVETNLVRVSPRVHYVLHLLLFKMTSGAEKRKMYFVFGVKKPSGDEIPYGYIKSSKGKITYIGELYSILEQDKDWNVI